MEKKIKDFIDNLGISCSSLNFYSLFFQKWIETEHGDFLFGYTIQEEQELSYYTAFSGVQDPLLYRMRKRADWIASQLIDENGNLDHKSLPKWITMLSLKRFLYPNGEHEFLYMNHMQNILIHFYEHKEFFHELRKLHAPLSFKPAEAFIKGDQPLKTKDIRRAVFSALLSPLRQNIGSCFATAPALLIQEENPFNLLSDLVGLLSQGQLKRTFGGIEYIAPLSISTLPTQKGFLSLTFTHQRVWYSPGFITALESIGFIDKTLSFTQKVEKTKMLIFPHLQKRSWEVESLVEELLREQLYLTRKELELYNQEIFSTLTQEKQSQCADLFEKKSKALSVFSSFTDHPLLKAWEFTLATFSQLKVEEANVHLRYSLALDPKETGGIGALIQNYLQEKLSKLNEKTTKLHEEYERAYYTTKSRELLLNNAASYQEMMTKAAHYRAEAQHMYSLLDMRNDANKDSFKFPEFFEFLISQINLLLKERFQELYDPTMEKMHLDNFADSPAGFRLLYKYSRDNPTQWMVIYGGMDYIKALTHFFSSIENELIFLCEWENGKEMITEITTLISHHLHTKDFLVFNLERAKKLEREGVSYSTPWSYISGGTLSTLVRTYFAQERELSQETRFVESSLDLGIFLTDLLKELPPQIYSLKGKERSFLMHSPTHAFLLKPSLFQAAWKEERSFTYSWLRDNIILKAKEFYDQIALKPDAQKYLINLFFESKGVEKDESPLPFKVSIPLFRAHLLSLSGKEFTEDSVDCFLLNHLPLFNAKEAEEKIKLFYPLYSASCFKNDPSLFFTAKALRDLMKALFVLSGKNSGQDSELQLKDQCIEIGCAPPPPFLFADTNWAHFFFALVFNPGTEKLELWRTDRLGLSGKPMKWENYLEGKSEWCVFTKPQEYA